MSQNIAVIDYGMGNLFSVVKAVEYVATAEDRVILTSCPEEVSKADRIVFPGQGAAKDCMAELNKRGLADVVRETAATKPFLGICMGLQVLMTHSDENDGVDCLDIFAGNVQHFPRNMGQELKIPHMGWNNLQQTRAHPLWDNIADESMFYFVHSYTVVPDDKQLTVAECDYGIKFTAAIAKDNIFAIQCHPEKSANHGLQLFTNFLQWNGTDRGHL